MSDGFVALTKCFYCGGPGDILLNRRPQHPSSVVRQAHGAVINMEPCNECKANMKLGIILIGVDDAKSDPGWNKQRIPNPYRSGLYVVVREEAFRRMIGESPARDYALQHRWMFIDEEAVTALRLREAVEQNNATGT